MMGSKAARNRAADAEVEYLAGGSESPAGIVTGTLASWHKAPAAVLLDVQRASGEELEYTWPGLRSSAVRKLRANLPALVGQQVRLTTAAPGSRYVTGITKDKP